MRRKPHLTLLTLVVVAAATCHGAAAIVGGKTISIEEAPWTVAVLNNLEPSSSPWCTGVILDSRHVLTAAHCLFYFPNNVRVVAANLVVEAGVSRVHGVASAEAEQRNVASTHVHPFYQPKLESRIEAPPDDIAVLTLTHPLDLSHPGVKAVPLAPMKAAFPAGRGVVVAGFGNVSANGASGFLHAMSGTVLGQGRCGLGRDIGYESLLPFNGVELCAQSAGGSCYGDSGAGVVTAGSSPVLLGILNEAPGGDCKRGIPAQFAYIGAPEIAAFLNGDRTPPRAPRPGTASVAYNSLHVGDQINCTPENPTRGGHAVITFTTGSGAVRQSGTNPNYSFRTRDIGSRIVCQIAVTNAGGTTLAQPTALDPVTP